MPTLITVQQAREHLRLGDGISPEDDDLQLKIDQATAIIVNYVERPDDEDWTDEIDAWTVNTVPKAVQAAVLLQLGELYRFRGDDVPADLPKAEHGFLLPAIVRLLHRYRDPAVA